jgi:ERCC4-type nuclease
MFTLEVDDREHDLIAEFKNEIVVKRLTIGDIAFYYRGILIFVIERKTLEDMIASLTDGRLKTQIANMKNIKQESYDPKRIIILETNKKIPSNIMAKLDHLMIRDDFYIIYTKSLSGTRDRILELCKNCSEKFLIKFLKPGPELDEKKQVNLAAKLETPIYDDVKKILKCIPKLGEETAISILNKYSILDFITNIESKEIKTLKVGQLQDKKIAPSIIKKFKDLSVETCIKLVSNVKGIGPKTLNKLNTPILIDIFKTKEFSAIDKLPVNNTIKRRIHTLLTWKI